MSAHQPDAAAVAEALQASELRYRRLFEAAQDGILILDAESGMIVDVNPFLIELLGFSCENFLGKKIWELGFFKDIVANQNNFAELQAKEYIRYEDMALETSDGRRIEVEFVSNVYLADGHKVMQCIIRVNTAHKRAEAARRESEEKFRTMFQSMAAASCIDELVYEDGKAVDYRVLDINPAFERIIGVSRSQAVGSLATKLYGPGKPPFFDVYVKVAETGEPVTFESYFPPIGKYLHVTASCPAKGKFSTVFTDTTERVRAEETLRENEARYRTLVESIPQKIFMKDRHYRWVSINETLAHDLGLRPEEVVGKMDTDLFPPEVAAKYHADDVRIMETGKTEELEEIYSQEGRETRVSTIKTPVRGANGEIVGVLGLFWDITERRQAEKALQKSESRLRETQKMAQLGHWHWDVRTGAVEWSEEVFNIFRLDPKTFTPKIDSILALSPRPEDHARDKELIRKAMESHETGYYEQCSLRPDGTTGYYQSTFQGNYDDGGKLIAIVGTVMDITESKRAEAALRQKAEALRASNAELEQFNRAMVGRELRMIELKQEINELCQRLGEPPRHATPPGGGGA